MLFRMKFQRFDKYQAQLTLLASLLLCEVLMKQRLSSVTPETVSQEIQSYVAERQKELLPPGDRSKDGRPFFWCGEILDFLTEGLVERFAAKGITFTNSFPGPLRLMDEDQQPDGQHVRRFWTVALHHGCPIARICTYFFHRHDQVSLPQVPRIVAYAPSHPAGEDSE